MFCSGGLVRRGRGARRAVCSTMGALMGIAFENCLHLGGLRSTAGLEFVCPACGGRMNTEEIERWVREAEEARDESYAVVEVDEFSEIVRE